MHSHPLQAIKVDADAQQNKDSEAARRQRMQSIQQHPQLPEHRSGCFKEKEKIFQFSLQQQVLFFSEKQKDVDI